MATVHYGHISIEVPNDDALAFYQSALRALRSGEVGFVGLRNHGDGGDRLVTITRGVHLAVEFDRPLTDDERRILAG